MFIEKIVKINKYYQNIFHYFNMLDKLENKLYQYNQKENTIIIINLFSHIIRQITNKNPKHFHFIAFNKKNHYVLYNNINHIISIKII